MANRNIGQPEGEVMTKSACSRVAILAICVLGLNAQTDGDDSKPVRKEQSVGERPQLPRERAQVLADVFSSNVQAMFKEPSADSLAASRMDLLGADVRAAQSNTWSWIRDVIDPKCAPKVEQTMEFVGGAGGGSDMTRVTWDAKELHFDVCQTRTAFAMRVTPLKGSMSEQNAASRAMAAREITRIVFVDSWRGHLNGTAEVTTVENLRDILSYGKNEFLELPGDKVVIGHRQGVFIANTPEDLHQFEFWFRQFSWWNDGSSTGFYFPKLTGPSAHDNTGGRYDGAWFKRTVKP